MNKSEIIATIAEQANLSKADADRALEGLLNAIESTLKAGDAVTLVHQIVNQQDLNINLM